MAVQHSKIKPKTWDCVFSLHLAQWMNEAQVDLQGSHNYTMPLDQFSAESPID